jgi:hypothetical protein
MQGLKSPFIVGVIVLQGAQVFFREGDKPSSAFYAARGVKLFEESSSFSAHSL